MKLKVKTFRDYNSNTKLYIYNMYVHTYAHVYMGICGYVYVCEQEFRACYNWQDEKEQEEDQKHPSRHLGTREASLAVAMGTNGKKSQLIQLTLALSVQCLKELSGGTC